MICRQKRKQTLLLKTLSFGLTYSQSKTYVFLENESYRKKGLVCSSFAIVFLITHNARLLNDTRLPLSWVICKYIKYLPPGWKYGDYIFSRHFINLYLQLKKKYKYKNKYLHNLHLHSAQHILLFVGVILLMKLTVKITVLFILVKLRCFWTKWGADRLVWFDKSHGAAEILYHRFRAWKIEI